MHLTDKKIDALALPAGKAEHKFFDDDIPGFGVRLRRGGASRFIFQYDFAKKTRRMTLGKTSAMTATRARATASELHAKVRLGEDPAGDKAESRLRAAESFKAILDIYMAG